jgi:hypothetical protein
MRKGEWIRKMAIGAMVLVFAGIIITSLIEMAPGEYQIGGNFITVDPNASGTKLSGTLLIEYELNGDSLYAKYFFVRLAKGNDLYRYSGSFSGQIGINEWPDQEGVITDFFKTVVIPELFPDWKSFALKSYSKLVGQDPIVEDDVVTGPAFAMFDFVVAVKE